MVRIIGWDIGGANCKAYGLDWDGRPAGRPTALSRPLAVWREPERLAEVLGEMARELGPAAAHAVTMTAELCDSFASKAEGVRYILEAARTAFGAAPLWVWTTEGRFASPEQVRDEPAVGAATNWLATGTWLSRHCDRALLIDTGTTTTDLTLIAGRRVMTVGRDDPGRLARGELVYTGMVRTPVCAVAPSLYLNGRAVRSAAELFAVTGDAHLLLGLIQPDDYAGPTPDGRPATPEAAGQRLARMLCADAADIGPGAARWLARQVVEEQVAAITRAALQVLSRAENPSEVPVVGTGLGRPLARLVAGRLGLQYADMADYGLPTGQVAPAGAAAHLLAEEVLTWPLPAH